MKGGFGESGGIVQKGDVVKRREEKVKTQSGLVVKREKKREGGTEEGVKVKVKSRRKAKADGEKAADTV